MGSVWILILSDAATLNVEARKAIHLFLKNRELLVRELAHEELLGETRLSRIARSVCHDRHAVIELLAGNVQGIAELNSVKPATGFVHDHHNVVGGLIEDQQLAVSVGNNASRWEINLFQEGIRVSTFLVVVTGNLEHEKPDNVDNYDERSHPTNHIAPVFKSIILHLSAHTL